MEPVHLFGRFGFLGEIADLNGAQLHFCCEFVTGNSGAQIGVIGKLPEVAFVQEFQKLAAGNIRSSRDLARRSKVRNGLIGVEGGALKNCGKKAGRPVVRAGLGHAARIGDGHESRQVLVHCSQGVRDPGAGAGKTV